MMLNSPTNARFHNLSGHVQHSPVSRPESVGSVHSATSDSASSTISTGRGPRRGQDICVSEELKIAVDLALDRFKNASPDDYHELEFPSSLTSTERAYIHRLAAANNFKSKSRGKNSNRYITVIRQETSVTGESAVLQVTLNSQQQMINLIQRFPLTNKEKHDLTPRTEKSQNVQDLVELNKMTTGKLNNGLPQIPPRRGLPGVQLSTLPIEALRREIVHTISDNQIVLISGETGCGKTTQVPQMILDACCDTRLPCRIICTQPRRLAALSVAERVANERGEKIGQIVGYQIRLESRVSPKTLLTYCTTGVLLRTLIAGDNALATVTHIVVDEIHERDRMCDFLLIVLKQALSRHRNLKVVLMSATMNTDLFLRYFQHCPIIQVPGSLYEVEEFYLEDVLKITGYMTKKMLECKQQLEKVAQSEGRLPMVLDADETEHGIMHRMDEEQVSTVERGMSGVSLEGEEAELPDPAIAKEVDRLITEIWMAGDEDLFSQIFHYILSENVSADYQHSETGVTPLMAACSRGMATAAEQLINLGANVHFKAIQAGCTALDIASRFQHEGCVDLLQSYASGVDTDMLEEPPSQELSPHDAILLESYHHSFDDEKVNVDLVVMLIKRITLTTETTGALLVFLPGYDDIVSLRDTILADTANFGKSRAAVFTLHSNLQTSDQKKAFKRPQHGIRKIILATNIAETSITIDDVVYVIDCGKVKEKSFDAFSNISMLKSNWISRASSSQRAGRAGRCRPGVAYHLFSSARYKNLAPFQVAEILRSPLQELCLQTKLLAPFGTSIADFLALAPEPPSFLITRNAVQLLQQMDALDGFEDLTELGHHLVDIPIEPRLGKMIINAVVLKCLDPILTITCTMAFKEPFVLPAAPTMKRAAAKARQNFSADSMSDHMAYLRVFQAWQRARSDGYERSFCEKNFVSSATMEMILGMRSLLLGQLRASGFVRARGGGDIRDLNTNSENWAVIKAALCAGTYPNLLKVDRSKSELKTQKEGKVRFHQNSVLNPSLGKITANSAKAAVESLPTDWVIYEELCRSQYSSFSVRNFPMANARCATVISAMTVALFAGSSRLALDIEMENNAAHSTPGGTADTSVFSSDSEEDGSSSDNKAVLSIDNWLKFKLEPQLAEFVVHLRQKWHSLLLRRLQHPSKQLTQTDEAVIHAMVAVLTSEEQASGLRQPSGIGQRPRPMSTMEGGGFSEYANEQQSDDSSSGSENRWSKNQKHSGGQQWRRSNNRYGGAGGDNHSDSSSVRSSPSNSRRSSTTNSPCNSPGPLGLPGKMPQQKMGKPCRYFVVKSKNAGMLNLSQSKGIWATTQQTATLFNAALQPSQTVMIIFTVNDSGQFHGVASLDRLAPNDVVTEFGQANLSTAYFINWMSRSVVPFAHTQSLYNMWSEGQPVSLSHDGQELETSAGEELVKLCTSSSAAPQGDNSHITILQRKP